MLLLEHGVSKIIKQKFIKFQSSVPDSCFKLVVVLSLYLIAATAVELQCKYSFYPFSEPRYHCLGKISTDKSDYTVNTVSGIHIPGKSSVDISTIVLKNVSLEMLPRNLNTWFKNYEALTIIDSANFPGFRRSDLTEFTRLTSIYVRNLPMIKQLGKDTFWDLKKLIHLYLEELPRLENLDGDFLINAKYLEVFSAKGPNRLTQISPGFFRNQVNSLRLVDFRNTNLVRIGYTVFVNLNQLTAARFHNAGCLNHLYDDEVAKTITTDIRARCQDAAMVQNNEIIKKRVRIFSSSDSSE